MTALNAGSAVAARAPIRVLVVDDSALVRKVLTQIIGEQPDMEVVGAAPDPLVARDMIKLLSPDVLTLDVEMPRMDGLDFLDRLMRLRPMPVLMVSSLTERGSEATLRALELGAVDFVAKPQVDLQTGLQGYADEIVEKLRIAARARPRRRSAQPAAATPAAGAGLALTPCLSADAVLASAPARYVGTERVILVGASTGGTEAIREFLAGLPADAPGVLITQHMPEAFTRSFALRLNNSCSLNVKEAENGERVLPGHAYVAPGHSHLLLRRSGANYVTELSQAPPVNRHRPSVDVLFRSAANCAGPNAVGVILTGMGKDGAQGLLEMKQAGAHTFAQDEASCVVFGMPREAIAAGAVDDVVSLGQMSERVISHVGRLRATRI